MPNRKTTLQNPYQSVTVECTAEDSYVCFNYIGTAVALLAAGAIEPGMTEPQTKGKRRLDSYGDFFHRCELPKGRFKITRFVTDTQRAWNLPGSLEDLSTHILRQLSACPNQVYDEIKPDSRERCFAGTQEALIGAGVAPVEAFAGRFDPPHFSDLREGVWIHKLRDGFWCVTKRATSTHEADDERSADEWKDEIIDSVIDLADTPIRILSSMDGGSNQVYQLPRSTHEKLREAAERFKREMESILRGSRVENITAPRLHLISNNAAVRERATPPDTTTIEGQHASSVASLLRTGPAATSAPRGARFEISHHVDDKYIFFDCLGSPTDLFEAGLIEEHMQFAGKTGHRSRDTHGDYYARVPRKTGVRVSRYITDITRARAILKMPDLEPSDAIQWLERHPREVMAGGKTAPCYSGTREVLIAAGHATADMFGGRFPATCFSKTFATDQEHATIECLMHGFFRVIWHCRKANAVRSITARDQSFLRLVISN